jgi:exonuclease III
MVEGEIEQWEQALETIGQRMQEASADNTMEEIQEQEEADEFTIWKGDFMDQKDKLTGLRLAIQNFERQLYATDEAIQNTAIRIKELEIDILIGFEPGKGDRERLIRLHNQTHGDELGSEIVTSSRNEITAGGGVVIWLTNKWAKVPRKVKRFEPKDTELNGRLVAVEFDNNKQGEHNKLLLIAMHGINSAHNSPKQAAQMQEWVTHQVDAFREKFPRASIILAGDLNAAKFSDIDTDRQGPHTVEAMEPDAAVIQDLENLGLTDVFRHSYPDMQAVTRRDQHKTNRYLDRIMATKEAATHQATKIAICKEDIHGGGSDHLMVMADFPTDTAAAAKHSTEMWERHTVKTWTLNEDELGKIKPSEIEAMNTKLENTQPASTNAEEVIEWYMLAAQNTMLKESTRTFPKPILKRKNHTSSDHKVRANLRHLRFAKLRTEWGEHMGTVKRTTKLLIPVPGTIHNEKAIKKIRGACRKKTTALAKLKQAIDAAEQYLKKEARKSREKEIRGRVKLRNNRFEDPAKKKLKHVITSIMRKMAKTETTTSVQQAEGTVSTEAAVGKAVTKFYRGWMRSRVKATDRWESQEAMMRMNPSELKDEGYADLIKTAYTPSFNKYTHLQETEGIWDLCRGEITLQDLIQAIKTMKSGTAPGASGLGYEIIKAINPAHLGPILDTVNQISVT